MNEIERAIDTCKRATRLLPKFCADDLSIIAVNALEKQIPKKPTCTINDHDFKIGNITFKKGTKRYNCSCGNLISKSYKYCPYCGCLIDWEV